MAQDRKNIPMPLPKTHAESEITDMEECELQVKALQTTVEALTSANLHTSLSASALCFSEGPRGFLQILCHALPFVEQVLTKFFLKVS